MNLDQAYLYYIWQKLAFQIVHKTTIWVLLVLFVTALCAWHLGNILSQHNARKQEAKLAYGTATSYTILAIFLWIFSFIMG